jgi:hypothetical protein
MASIEHTRVRLCNETLDIILVPFMPPDCVVLIGEYQCVVANTSTGKIVVVPTPQLFVVKGKE